MKGKIWMLVTAVLTAGFLVGCRDNTPTNMTEDYILPQPLKERGCEIYRVKGSGMTSLNVVYCPSAQVTTEYSGGKTQQAVTTIDGGVDYGH